jgi:hypothetical protein
MAKIDFSKNPYRGVLSYIARRRKVSKQAVHKAYNNNNPTIVAMVVSRVRAIDRSMQGGRP